MTPLLRLVPAVLLAALASPSVRAANPLRIKTAAGKVEGTLTPDGKVRAFKGIPYAAPPTGDLRWRPPRPHAPWKGTRDARDFGAHCFQSATYPDMVFHDPGPGEDCLTLNVWTPAGARPGSLPVMVWIYGGGFAAGGTSESRQDGQFLAHRNVVVVSMNYRLGIFGFFAHPALAAESPQQAAGNYGLLDQAAALRWVHDNIRNFGGDPANVTLFGESAGSISVSAHMASPLSRTLIARAIGESGGAFPGNDLPVLSFAQRETRDAAIAEADYGTASLAALRQLTPQQLLAPTLSGARKERFGMNVDGYFLPRPVPAIYAAREQAHIPLLAGWNADEARASVTSAPVQPTLATFTAQATQEFGGQASQFLAAYNATSDESAVTAAGDYAGDRFIAFSTWRWLEAQAATGAAPVFRFRFDLGSPGDRNHPASAGAFHSDDIEYVFGTLDSRAGMAVRPKDRALSDQIGAYWTNFARTGNPNSPTADPAPLPPWPPYNAPGQWPVMHLDRTSAAAPDAARARYLFLNRFLQEHSAASP